MKRILAVICLAACAAPAPAPVATAGHTVEDRPGPACTDFYAYSAGKWLEKNPLPEGAPRWSPRLAGKAESRKRLVTLLEETAARADWPAGSAEKLAGDTFASCMGDAAGMAPLAPLQAEIDHMKTRADVNRVLRHLHDVGIPAGFTLAASLDYHTPTQIIANLTPASPAKGADPLAKRLAGASLDAASAADPAKTDHRMTFAELGKLAPSVEWRAYFDEAKIPKGDVNVAEPRYFEELEKALREAPVAAWKAYFSAVLHAEVDPYLAPPEPRATFCADSTEALLGDPVGKLFVERAFSPQARARVVAMMHKLHAVLRDEVAQVTWMTPETKKQALAKLDRYDMQAGYPKAWKDTSAIAVRRDAILANVLAGRRFNVSDDRRRIGKPADRDYWLLPASSAGAYIDLQLGDMVLPAGFLLSAGYKDDMSDTALYAQIGVAAAHDIAHAIDLLGADNDVEGRPQNWYTAADRKGWDEHVACVLAEQEKLAPGSSKRVETEAVGDLSGLHVAYQALGKPDPEFFVIWGESRAEVYSPATEAQMLKSDPHPLGKFRVLGTAAVSQDLAKAFSCPVPPPCGAW